MVKNRILLPALILLILACRFFFAGEINRLFGIDPREMGPEAYFLYQAAWYLLPLLVVMPVIHPPAKILRELGLAGGFLKGFLLAVLFTLPMFTAYAFFGQWPEPENIGGIVFTALFAGFFEELFFRGFVFGQLFCRAKWGFVPASLVSGIFFGMGHLYQSHDLLRAAMIFGITFVGSAWFSWLFLESGKNLWLPLFLHVLMNLSWGLFSMDVTALGNWPANLPRILTIALSILYIVIFVRKQGPLTVRRHTLWMNRPSHDERNDQG